MELLAATARLWLEAEQGSSEFNQAPQKIGVVALPQRFWYQRRKKSPAKQVNGF
jgi:hypothetical protein